MDRDKVLEWLDAAGEPRGPIEYEMVRKELLRAAAELIRQGGWRPIAEAPEWQSLIVGVWGERVGADGASVSHEWFVEAFQMKKHEAIREGYTHYLPEPDPPAREVENG